MFVTLKDIKDVAYHYVLSGISKQQAAELLGCSVNKMPVEFNIYCAHIEQEYKNYINKLQKQEQ